MFTMFPRLDVRLGAPLGVGDGQNFPANHRPGRKAGTVDARI